MSNVEWRLTVLITVEMLNKIFKQNSSPKHFTYRGQCHHCGRDVEVEITKTSGGYGFQGGVLHASNPEDILVCCLDCHPKDVVPN
jgi:hypothetical protein